MTKNAYTLLKAAYKEYCRRVKAGKPTNEARYFGSWVEWGSSVLPAMNEENYGAALIEMAKELNVRVFMGLDFELSLEAINMMENRYKRKFSDFLEFVLKFR